MESPVGEQSSTLPGDSKKAGYSVLLFGPYAQTTARDLSPDPRQAQGSDPLVHRGELQHMAAELGSYKQAHTSPPPLTLGPSRGAVHGGIGPLRPPATTATQTTLHRPLMDLPADGEHTGLTGLMAHASPFQAEPLAGSCMGKDPATRRSPAEPQPQAWLQGGAPPDSGSSSSAGCSGGSTWTQGYSLQLLQVTHREDPDWLHHNLNNSELVIELQGLNDSLTNRHIYFAFALISYLFTIFVNLIVIITICLEKSLHEPIYIFLCNMCFNGIYGASSFYPKLLHDLLADSHIISYFGCLTQIFVVYCYVFCEVTSLTVMAYDRYLAICKPLQYRTLMTVQRVAQLLLLSWSFSMLETVVGIVLTARLPLCGSVIQKIFCTNWEVVKLSCSDTTLNSIYGLVLMFSHLSQAGLIIVSYTHLVRASLRLHSNRRKFIQTCVPHLSTLLIFTGSLVFDTMYSRYGGGGTGTMQALQNTLAAEFLVVPPLLNPIIYGINLHQIRSRILNNFTQKLEIQKTRAR
ncbi:hypothetical protein L3Q82_004875 [Scortum barcoo]|uniref:Uncharacterized protein n=1 Tax=Scortum barcoo TaxID=214431 RepID=A0ACB8VD59_9TELE|nr:hypothetical protein L3Q82_004875 [Scortum barcoo]